MKHLILLLAFLISAVSSFGQAPTTNATDPEARDSVNVISIFSGAYTDVEGTNYNPNWGQAGFNTANTSFDPGTGNVVLAYPNLNYQGIQFGSSQDISSMEFLHIDIWIKGTFNPNITVISSGAEIANPITNTGAGSWISADIPVSGITGDPTSVIQFKFDGGNGSSDSIYVDNLYFWKNATTPQNDATLSDLQVDGTTITDFSAGVSSYTYGLVSGTTTVPQITATTTEANATTTITQATAIPGDATVEVVSDDESRTKTYTVSFAITTPGVAAPAPPARDAADVISIFSDAYTDIAVETFSADVDNSNITEVLIAGNATKRIDFTNYLQVEFVNNKQDASTMTHFHMDFWFTTSDMIGKVFNSKFVDFGGGATETSALELNINGGSTPQLEPGMWVSIDVPFSSWANNPSVRSDLAQFVMTSNLDVVYVDNIYMYKEAGSGGSVGLPETFDAASSITTWTTAGSAASNASEVTFEWAETAGVDASGAMRFGGTNADGAGGRAYILEKTFTDIDFGGETNVDVSVSITSESITNANISILTDIAGSIQQNASANSELSDSEYTTFTFNHPTISAAANTVKVQFNVAAGAVVGGGGTLLIDDINVSAAGSSGGGGFAGLTNGDFEAGRAPWTETAGEIRTEGDNSFFFADVATAGEPFNVNLSQVLELAQGETYELTFEASTSAGNTRTMIAGIGLNEAPFTSSQEEITLTDQTQTFKLNLTAGFGSANSRVLFDMGAAVGIVVLDNVSLIVGESATVPEPVTAAPTPPERDAADVISLFSNAYTNVPVTTWSTDWSQGSSNTDIMVEGDDVKRFDFLSPFSGIQLENSIDLSNYTHMHIDYWVPDTLAAGQVFNPKLSNHGNLPGAAGETSAIEYNNPVTESQTWVSFDVLLSDFTVASNNADRDKIYQIILAVAGTLDNTYIDNFYFYREGGTVSNELDEKPASFALNQNYPNPFNPTTNISFNLATGGDVTLEVYNIQGQKVATLVSGFKSSGSHSVAFDASNLASGVYAYRLISNNSVQVKKMMLIK